MRNRYFLLTVILMFALTSTALLAQDTNQPAAAEPAALTSAPQPAARTPADENKVLDAEIRALRQSILEMNSELSTAEKEFLFPASTQFTVFVSMDTSKQFDLRSVELRLDNKVVAHHLYTDREVYALQRGGS